MEEAATSAAGGGGGGGARKSSLDELGGLEQVSLESWELMAERLNQAVGAAAVQRPAKVPFKPASDLQFDNRVKMILGRLRKRAAAAIGKGA